MSISRPVLVQWSNGTQPPGVAQQPSQGRSDHQGGHSFAALFCALAALVPAVELVRGQPFIPTWLLDIALVVSLGAAAYLSRQLSAVRSEARVDSLTGTLTRRNLERVMDRLVVRGERFGLVFADLDGLKRVNDTRGHLAGDNLLRHVADSITTCIRPTDYVFRFGGDEFVVVLPGADVGQTRAVGERITRVLGNGVVSVGVAAFPEDGADAASVLEAADRAMYQAKTAGTDRNWPT